jgi:hypothetical protein
MASGIEIALWAKQDENDKYDREPNGAFCLSGSLQVKIPADIVLHGGQQIGVSIKRNRNKKNDKAPDYFGELFTFTEKEQK